MEYRLGEDPSRLPLAGVDSAVHCAWDLKATTWDEIAATNVQGSIALLQAAQAAGVRRIIFISSMSAYAGCRSMYGRAKCLVEAETLKLGLAIRPGLVWAEKTGGIVGAMEGVICRSPIVPLIGSGNYLQYPAHCDDVAEFIFQASQLEPLPSVPLSAASAQPLTFRGLLQALATRAGKKPLFLPPPWTLLYAGLPHGRGAPPAPAVSERQLARSRVSQSPAGLHPATRNGRRVPPFCLRA
ncbi:MAG: NAD-dependent epimerase/dehydratase family protein [Chthoniobacteraceae bacterium]